jgi:hypothetical protein
VIAFVMLAALPVLGAGPGPQRELPPGTSPDWWTQVQRSIQLEEYGIVGEDAGGAQFRAANPAHRFETDFDTGGLRLKPTAGSSWEWRLALTGWGRPESLETGGVARLRADEDRIEFDRGPLTEWFVNTPDGLEHGFTVPVRPREEGDQLVFDLAIAGGLRPVFAEDGQAIDFYSSGNVSVLRYGKLVVTDAGGDAIPARMEPIIGGVRIVVDDSGAIYPLSIDPLLTSSSWTAVGEASGNQFGRSVATAGDVNGDGYSDVIVGAFSYAGSTGKAYLFLGGPSGPLAIPSWTKVGEATNSNYGSSVATAGDVNGDGYSDVVIGAYGNAASTGKAYLYLGGATGLSATAAWTAVGEAASNFFGSSVATAGDVNGDGRSDVVVGAYGNATSTGKAYLYLGTASGLASITSWTAVGEAASNFFGASVATAGDVNSDGRADVVVGAYGNATSRGKTYLYLGTASGLASTASWTAVGEAASNFFGSGVATAGDVNGDGYSDVLVGAYGNASSRGKAYLYLGTATGLSVAASWTAVGEAASDFFASCIATAGDVNGDGYSDVAIGAYGNGSSTGKAYLYLGRAIGLSSAASWTAVGEGTTNSFGRFVATAGDVNGDGRSDLVIGADGYSGSTGKAYLYLGGASGLSATTLWSAAGEATGNLYGYSVATAGDVNGDGYSDVVVGASGYSTHTGKVYVYLGGASGLSATASWTKIGESTSNDFGWSVATAGDVNGDGYSDVAVGANNYGSGSGKVYVYLGGASGLSATASWTKTGASLEGLAWSVASAGDVNGDGYADVLIGSMAYSNHRGRAQLYLGGVSGLSATSSWTKQGEQFQDEFGGSVASAGDVNGDGYADVVIGAGGYPGGGTEFPLAYGRAYLYLGGAGGLSGLSSWTVTGEHQSASFGGSIASAGDVNGDGYSDVIVGSPQMLGGGKAYLYLGGPTGLPVAASWSLTSETSSNYFGCSVASAGDVNGDGYSDVLIGAYGNDTNTGKAYLYLGGASGLTSTASWTAVGEAGYQSRFGISVAPAGDVNGDGYADVVVGADRYNSFAGKAYLYLGGAARGVAVVPRQFRSDLSTPLGLGGAASGQQFGLGLTLQSPAGRVKRRLQWQAGPRGNGFSLDLTPIQSDATWFDTPVARKLPVSMNAYRTPYVWRARVRYSPASSPFVPYGPWFTMTGNGQREGDLINLSGGACTNPNAALFIPSMKLVGGKPVLTYQDPNTPAAVTGYNIYRAAAATGPWMLVGSNVGDTDPGTSGLQYADSTGDIGSAWYYKVAAYNAACGVEGPR